MSEDGRPRIARSRIAVRNRHRNADRTRQQRLHSQVTLQPHTNRLGLDLLELPHQHRVPNNTQCTAWQNRQPRPQPLVFKPRSCVAMQNASRLNRIHLASTCASHSDIPRLFFVPRHLAAKTQAAFDPSVGLPCKTPEWTSSSMQDKDQGEPFPGLETKTDLFKPSALSESQRTFTDQEKCSQRIKPSIRAPTCPCSEHNATH
jgi:hypothetical protein